MISKFVRPIINFGKSINQANFIQNFSTINIPKSKFGKKRESEDLPYLELTRDFVDPAEFYNLLIANKINFFTGVPDSLLKDFCGYISDNHDPKNHIIAANEG